MAGKQANWPTSSLTPVRPDYPLRNRVIVLLSVKAGLRAGEIAKLTWDMVLDRGSLRDVQLLAGHWPIGTAHRRDQILRSSSISFAET